MKVSTSILSAKDIGKCLAKLNNSNTDYIHLDIMDGKFVSNKTWHIDDIASYLDKVNKPLDVHLMVTDVINYINEFSFINPDYITFHLEAVKNAKEVINYIRNLGIRVGISIKPKTNIEDIYKYLPYVDLVLIMSVEPGFGGQDFIKTTKTKLNKLRKYKDSHNLKFMISVDGGINDETIESVSAADMVVAGNYIVSGDYNTRIDKLRLSK